MYGTGPSSASLSTHPCILGGNIPGVAHVRRISSRNTDSREDLTFLHAERLCAANGIRGCEGWEEIELSREVSH